MAAKVGRFGAPGKAMTRSGLFDIENTLLYVVVKTKLNADR
jgi:hypothetical protein